MNKVKGKQILLDTDVTLSANSNVEVPSQRAIKSYIDAKVEEGLNEISVSVMFVQNVPYIINYGAVNLTDIFDVNVFEDVTASLLELIMISYDLDTNNEEIIFYPNTNITSTVKIIGVM